MVFRVIKIDQLAKNPGLTFGPLSLQPRMTPKRAIVYLLKCMTQILPRIRLWFYRAEKTKAEKIIWNLP